MSQRVFLFMLVGVVAVGAAVYWALQANRGAKLEVAGTISKVRAHPINDNAASFVVVDFRATNTSRHTFQVEDVNVIIETASGELREGSYVSEKEAGRAMQHFPLMGPKYNDTLIARTRIAPGETRDWMLAAMFELPVSEVEKRKSLRLRIVERDRRVSEISEAAPPESRGQR